MTLLGDLSQGPSSVNSVNPWDEQVAKLVEELLGVVGIEEAFCGFVKQNEENERNKLAGPLNCFRSFWSSKIQHLGQEEHDKVLKIFVHAASRQRSQRRSSFLFQLLDRMIESGGIPARSACDSLLQNENLTYENSHVWSLTFKIIRKHIGGVDYKGCRDFLRAILERAQQIPDVENVSIMEQLNALEEVVAYLLDRNSCLLPAYFSVNEITKMWSKERACLHWKLSQRLASFVQSFRSVAQMVTCVGRQHLLPVIGHSTMTSNVWKLQPNGPAALTFTYQGPLPYKESLYEPQTKLLRFVLEQPYSRDMVSLMMSLNKAQKVRCTALEDQLVEALVEAMKQTAAQDSVSTDSSKDDDLFRRLHWQHLGSQLIHFVLFQFTSFPHMVNSLYKKLETIIKEEEVSKSVSSNGSTSIRSGRQHLMWVLLQFISGSIQKNMLQDFLPVLRLYDLLYPETEAISVPDFNQSESANLMAITCIWIHLQKKAQSDNIRLQRSIPPALKNHLEFLQTYTKKVGKMTLPTTDFRICLLCNAYSTNTELFNTPMTHLIKTIYDTNKANLQMPGPGSDVPGSSCIASSPSQPLSMALLDSLTVHAKMSLIHSIVSKVMVLAQTKTGISLSPSLVETYSRLLVYTEIESLGIKGFISQVLPKISNAQAWGILHTLIEIFAYKFHHIGPHYRIQLLHQLHSLSSVIHHNLNQLHICAESAVLRLLTGLGSAEVQPQLSRLFSDMRESRPLSLISPDSEELNRVLVLTLARAMHVTGSEAAGSVWMKEFLSAIKSSTPHAWSQHTLSAFPQALQDFFQANTVPKENRLQLKKVVEDDYRKWKAGIAGSMNEMDLINNFSGTNPGSTFLCVIFKSMVDGDRLNATVYRVLERIGAKGMMVHIRTLADFLVTHFSGAMGSQDPLLNKYMECLNQMIWKYNIVPMERLILVLSIRFYEANEAQVSFYTILNILKTSEFSSRVTDLTKDLSPQHWLQDDWHEKHLNYHQKYPDRFFHEGLQLAVGLNPQQTYLPTYYGNVCFRLFPVLDVVLHRFIEMTPNTRHLLENFLDVVGPLFKFHEKPITYLYNTLHYYDKKLKSQPGLRKKLVVSILSNAQRDPKQPYWCLSETFVQKYIRVQTSGTSERTTSGPDSWDPDMDYYLQLVSRLVDTLDGRRPPPFPDADWRFNEFPNAASHALYSVAVELMASPTTESKQVSKSLMNLVLRHHLKIPRRAIGVFMNVVGLTLTSLPDSFLNALDDEIVEMVKHPFLKDFYQEFFGLVEPSTSNESPINRQAQAMFELFDFETAHAMFAETPVASFLALAHAVWQHASIGQLSHIPQLLKDLVKPIIETEAQFLFICHLVGPLLQRFHHERTRCIMELTLALYELLVAVDHKTAARSSASSGVPGVDPQHLYAMDPICDFLYHIKYMFVGDGVRAEAERSIRGLRPALQVRLRFISHHPMDHANVASQNAPVVGSAAAPVTVS